MSALALERSGVDLVHVWVPAMHREVAKNTSLNFQTHIFGSMSSDEISGKDRTRMLEFLATIDAAVIGPGLSRTKTNLKSLLSLLAEAPCPLVVDASALQPETLEALHGRNAILTPHLGELERMGIDPEKIGETAKEYGCTILLKGEVDRIATSDGSVTEVKGGNPGLTVGGTGDALAGLVCGLIAQGTDHADAAAKASAIIKSIGDSLQKTHGYGFTTHDVITQIPAHLSTSF